MSVVMPTRRPGIWRTSASVDARRPRYGPPYCGWIPSGCPSPAGTSLGGVNKTTRETIAIAEAAGFDVVLVETVGVGQSETAVSNMVDVYVVLAIPGAGDELQSPATATMSLVGVGDRPSTYRFEGSFTAERAGRYGFAVRVVPGNPDLVTFAELGCPPVV